MDFFRILDHLGNSVNRIAEIIQTLPRRIVNVLRRVVQNTLWSIKYITIKLRKNYRVVSFEKRVAFAVTATAIMFICWQMFAYSVYQSLFIIVNLIFTAGLALYVSRLLFRIRQQRQDFEQRLKSLAVVRQRREAELQQARAENERLKLSINKEKVYAATSESLISAIRDNKAESHGDDERGHYILLGIAQCFEICGGVIYLRDEKAEEGELSYAGSYALDEKPANLTITANDAMVGEVFESGKPMFLPNVPSENMCAITGLGRARRLQMYILPLSVNNQIVGIIEIASFVELEIANIWNRVNEQLAKDL